MIIRVHIASVALAVSAALIALFERGAKLALRFGETELAGRWQAIARAERAVILERGFNASLGFFTQALDGEHPDASNLLLPTLGIIENMSYFLCPSCGTRSDIFGHGGARKEAERLGVPFLGEIPLHMEIRAKSDLGQPVVASDPKGPHAKIYCEIAERCWRQLAGAGARKAAPHIVME